MAPRSSERPRIGERLLRRPGRWPLRWRLAGVSAGLTAAILVLFALVIGQLTSDRIRQDFHQELRTAAGQLAAEIEFSGVPGAPPTIDAADLRRIAIADAAAARIVYESGEPVVSTPGAPPLGPPTVGVHRVGSLQVATVPILSNTIGGPRAYVQYARDYDEVGATIARLWLFLAAGVLAGTALAALAGSYVASRAMRPISDLIAAAREVTSTRDPSRRVPQTATADEVAELARTLEEMLQGLDAARAEREQVMQAQRDFVADASHELRTPLTSVQANLELLEASLAAAERAGTADADRHETVASALRSSRRMGRLVSDLLLLARADAGRPTPRSTCDLAELAASAVDELAPVATDHEIGLDTEGPVPVECNPDEIHRLISNLLDNAVRHTPGGTRVDVHVKRQGEQALLEVADTGPGLPEGAGDQLFQRFVRGSGPADRSATGGTGLGLAIVSAVTSSHGGTVSAGTGPAGGARFEVSLPLSPSRLAAESGRVGVS